MPQHYDDKTNIPRGRPAAAAPPAQLSPRDARKRRLIEENVKEQRRRKVGGRIQRAKAAELIDAKKRLGLGTIGEASAAMRGGAGAVNEMRSRALKNRRRMLGLVEEGQENKIKGMVGDGDNFDRLVEEAGRVKSGNESMTQNAAPLGPPKVSSPIFSDAPPSLRESLFNKLTPEVVGRITDAGVRSRLDEQSNAKVANFERIRDLANSGDPSAKLAVAQGNYPELEIVGGEVRYTGPPRVAADPERPTLDRTLDDLRGLGLQLGRTQGAIKETPKEPEKYAVDGGLLSQETSRYEGRMDPLRLAQDLGITPEEAHLIHRKEARDDRIRQEAFGREDEQARQQRLHEESLGEIGAEAQKSVAMSKVEADKIIALAKVQQATEGQVIRALQSPNTTPEQTNWLGNYLAAMREGR